MSINYNGTIKSLRDIVWGVVTDPLSQIEQITLLIFIKLLSERHNELERLKAKKLIFTGEYASYHFDSLSRLSGYELVDTTRKAVESLYKNPNIDEPIRRLYERSYLQVNDPRVLSLLINEINKIDITHIDMGDFYEHLLAVLGTQKEAGQFRTPRHLIEFIVNIVDPQIGERVLDPACGTAGFLTAVYTHIRDANTSQEARKTDSYLDKLNFDQKTFLLNKTIFGFDIDPKMIKFAISNLYLHNIKNPNISQHNTLTSNDSWEEKYEVILTNPPFSTPKGGVRPTDRFTLDSKRTEVLFAEYVIEHLTLNGRAGVIVPEGIIFQSGKVYKELRKWLIENNYLYAVVSLPAGVFNPYAGVKTSILFLDREQARQSDKILFCKVENDGFDLGAQRRQIDKNDLPEVLRIVKEYKTNPNKPLDSKLAYVVKKDKIIKSGDYNLTGDRYKETASITNQKWPIVELGDVCEILNGYAFKSNLFNNQHRGIPIIRIRDVNSGFSETFFDGEYDEKYIIDNGDLVIGMDGDFIATIWKHGRALLNQRVCKLEKYHGVIKNYIYYIIQKELDLIHKKTYAVTVKHISSSQIQKINISLPPLSVQQQIVDELEGYQKIIDGAKQVVNNYKPQIKIDPEWKIVKIGEVANLMTGGTPLTSKKEYYGGDIKWLVSGDINKGKIFDCDGRITELAIKESNARLLPIGSVLIALNGQGKTRGTVAILRTEAACNQSLVSINPDKNKLTPEFLFYVLKGKYQEIRDINGDNQRGGLNMPIIRSIQISLPSLETQKQIVARIEEEQKLVETNKKLIQLFEQKIKDKIAEVWGE